MALLDLIEDLIMYELMGRRWKQAEYDSEWGHSQSDKQQGAYDTKERHFFGDGDDEANVEEGQLVKSQGNICYVFEH